MLAKIGDDSGNNKQLGCGLIKFIGTLSNNTVGISGKGEVGSTRFEVRGGKREVRSQGRAFGLGHSAFGQQCGKES